MTLPGRPTLAQSQNSIPQRSSRSSSGQRKDLEESSIRRQDSLLKNNTFVMLHSPSTRSSVKRKRRSQQVTISYEQLQQATGEVLTAYDELCTEKDVEAWPKAFEQEEFRSMRWLLRIHKQWEKKRNPSFPRRISRRLSWKTQDVEEVKGSAMSNLREHFKDTQTPTAKELEQQSSFLLNHLIGLTRGWVHQVMESWKSKLITMKMVPKDFSWNRQQIFESVLVAKIIARAMELAASDQETMSREDSLTTDS